MMMNRRRSGIKREWAVAVVGAGGEMESLEAGKQEIMRRMRVAARDLRRMLSSSSRTTIAGRECAIVINLEHIKCIITANEALFLNSRDPSLVSLLHHLHNRIILPPSSSTNILPFEFVALEACLHASCTALENHSNILHQEAHTAFYKLTSEINILNLERVRQIKNRLLALTCRAHKVRDELERLLDNDENMIEMYLTNKLRSEDAVSNVEELEMLLGAYLVQIGGTLNKLFTVREYAEETEEYIKAMLKEKQDKLLQMAVRVGTANVIAEAFITVVGIFTINIHIDLFQKHALLPWIAGGCVASSIFLYVFAIVWYRHKHLLD
ncbi:magnesium transporter MRS2-3 [Arachis stenosperma]|uniref:magnesium transporter MRS2-3 n=1 Tax=Arachis stenosperma TaxID=217475 RepID=UPI0025AC8C5B|nr:magnesium transporter MRS2-3 [Arachis stenosperma]